MIENDDLRDFIVSRRRAFGWTQEQLAEQSTLSVRTIRNLEAGAIRNPRQSSVALLMTALDVAVPPVRTLYSVPPPAPAPTAPADCPAPADRPDPADEPQGPLGRAAELRQLLEAVAAHRLVVLTGPGGVGKSRLALAAAERLRGAFGGQVTTVELTTLAPEPDTGADAAESIRRALPTQVELSAGGERLIVLDCATHVVRGVSRLARQLLAEHPGLRLLVTSRRPLLLASARVCELGPLRLDPDAGEALSPAAELFLRRARASCPTLDLGSRPGEVSLLCRRLEGLPLAIEAAAQCVRAVPLGALLRDGTVAQVLGQATGSVHPHQRTLAENVRWSHRLLTAEQRSLLRQLALFGGRFTIEEVEAACGREAIGTLTELVDASLVQVHRRAQYTYSLLAVVREFVDRLPVAEQPDAGAHDWRRALEARTPIPAQRQAAVQSTAVQSTAMQPAMMQPAGMRQATLRRDFCQEVRQLRR